ncbi:symmetrical bis(5'-nucleosyl)-tetraphosphatase [Candidatus Spongiihabitans sp.]|uniref:symmetrical bis(5'-nucleosyl)-tetraphosphatase n=1 Tax=Candidatus Spongiihabitans sp. TaxID=3101308 RepID=UPI003C7E634E
MAVYAIGDIQGCVLPFEELLDQLDFDPSKDKLWLTGDLVNRGPDSLQTLRLVKKLSENPGKSVITVLGNHDLHFLAVAEKIRRSRPGDTFKQFRKAADLEELIAWLRQRPLVHCDKKLKVILAHAGVYPGWNRKQLIKYARKVETKIQGKKYREFLKKMYGRQSVGWSDNLKGWNRIRFITNALTRMRYCDARGKLNFTQKGAPGSQPKRLMPWYEHPDMKCKKWRIVFGHWSALGYTQNNNIISLDSGCVWGGKLTAARLDANFVAPVWQLDCR